MVQAISNIFSFILADFSSFFWNFWGYLDAWVLENFIAIIRYWINVHFKCLSCVLSMLLQFWAMLSLESKKCSFIFKLVRVWQQVADHISKYIMIHWNSFANHLTKLCASVLNYRFLVLIKLHTQSQLHLLIIDLTLNWSEHRASTQHTIEVCLFIHSNVFIKSFRLMTKLLLFTFFCCSCCPIGV